MENKYYDLIVSLVKSHEKYEMYQELLDDIVKDVEERSKFVINSDADESVVETCLTKMVAVSMVSVPKKKGYKTRKSADVETILSKAQANHSENIEEISYEETASDNSEPVDDELVFKMINTMSAEEEQAVSENYDEIEMQLADEIEDETETDFTDEISVAEETKEAQELALINDLGLVGEDEINSEQEEIYELGSEDEEVEEQNEIIAEDEPQLDLVLKTEEETVIEQEEQFSAQDNAEEEFMISDSEVSLDLEPALTEETYSFENIDDLETEEASTLEFNSDDSEGLDLNLNSELEQSENRSTAVGIYDKFRYTPATKEYDLEDIRSALENLDSKNPEERIKEVYDLKYVQNKSVSETAEMLNMSEEELISKLNDIIQIVKD